jgi:hypothetical protein
MSNKYLFGKQLTENNYQALKKLAQKLSYRDFHESTGFAHGIHNRLRRFRTLKDYKKYIKENRRKYVSKGSKKDITTDVFSRKYYYIRKPSANGKGVLVNGKQFLVFSGSRARFGHTESYARQAGKLKIKQQLQSEKIVDRSSDGKWLNFKRPYLFNSPSQAASFMLGNPTNGWDAWRDINGNKLALERAQ